MLRIRLMKLGSKNSLFYRIVLTDRRNKGTGMPKKMLGYWDPRTNTKQVDLDEVKRLIKDGAKETKTVKKLLNL